MGYTEYTWHSGETTATLFSGGPELLATPGASGELVIVRFTAPWSGAYSVFGWFGASYPGTAEVAVLLSGTELFRRSLEQEGGGSSAFYSSILDLSAGQTLDFLVGPGAETSADDGAYVEINIIQDPDPTQCPSSGPPTCNDENPCTEDGCSAAAGCTHTPVANGYWCWDAEGHSGTCQSGTCFVEPPPDCTNDHTPPSIAITSPANGSFVRTSYPTITTSTDDPKATVVISGRPLVEGENTVTATATDPCGNSASTSITLVLDTTRPVVTISGVQDGAYYNTDVQPVIEVTDRNLVTVQRWLNGAPYAGEPITIDGSYQLWVKGVDAAQNFTDVIIRFVIDKLAPQIYIAGVPPTSRTPVTPVVQISDSYLATSEILLDGASFTSGTPVTTDGSHLLVARATDRAGNSSERQVSFFIDQSPPALVVTAPAEGAVVTTPSVAVTGTVADLSAVTVTVNAVDVPATAGAFATTLPVASGTNTVTVAATDALGNVSVVVRHFTGCTPRTCGSQGKDCGPMPDGCGGTLDCGTCAVPQTCGGGGIPNVCGGAPLPDPVTVAPPVDPTVATNLAAATSFLYSGPNALQNGVAPGALDPKRVALLRGKVFTRELTPLSGARVTLLGEPQLGGTWTREDGAFDLVVNGGELTVHFEKPGYFPAQRQVALGWQETQTLPDVVLLSQDSQVTLVDLSSAASLPQVARGSPVEDTDGARQQTLFFPAGTLATMELPDGTSQPLPILSVRMTEYTVGASGPKAMPAELPPGVGYTYAVELNADEAVAAGALHVRFNQPIVSYTENFLNLPTGTPVPLGEYDRDRGVWVPAPSGRVIQILSIGADGAELDLDGSGTPASPAALAALQITGAERFELAALYAPGQSLWRVLIPHFTRPWDKNMRISLPCGGKCPPNASLVAEMPLPKPDCLPGSIIEAQNQVLGEAAGITGTPFTLHYRSNRVWGHKVGRRARLRVSGDELPTGLLAILVEVHIAGRSFEYRLPSTPNQLFTFEWDGLDAYGRRLQGLQPATARIGYEYQPVYVETDQFGYTAGPAIMLMEARQTLAVWQTLTFLLGTWEARALGLGGWTLDAHHAYDPQGLALYRGDGASRRGLGLDQGVGRTVAGTGGGGFSGDNGPAADAALHRPQALATDGRGNLYIADTGNNRVRKVGTDGRITTLAGGGAYCYGAAPCGDGFDATSAWLQAPTGVAVDDRGNVYIADWEHHRVRKVGPDGIITTVAGTGVAGFSGDGGPARSAELRQPRAVAADSYGNVYIADTGNERIRRVSADGIIRTIAGSGEPGGESGDGGPATEARLGGPLGIAVDGQGNVYVASDWGARVRKVDASSRITAFAGKDRQWCYWYGWCCTGEDCQATEVNLVTVRGLAVDRDGSVYLTSAQQVRKVGPDGIIRTVAGTGNAGSGGENGPPLGMELNAPWALALDPHGQLYVAENYGNRVRKVAPALPRYTGEAFALVSEDGTELYAFDAAGRHLRTRDALTNVTLYELGYDSGGLLTTVTDAYNNETRIERDSEGIPTAIVAPGGQRTALTLHPSGYLATVANPAQETTGFTYYGNDGLLETLTKPRGGVYRFTYDTLGRLTQDADPATGSLSLDRTDGSGAAYSVQATTAMGRVSGYAVDYLPSGAEQRTETDPSGKQTVARRFPNESREVTLPDGTVTTLTRGPDPRFGMQAPMVKSLSVRTPSGLTLSATANRSVTLSNPNDATTLVTQTDTVTVNGKSHTSLYDAALRRVTTTSPMGRQRVAYLDEKGRLSQVQVPGFAPVSFGHDDRGRLETITAGTGPAARAFTLVYDAQNRLERIIDPRNQTTLFGYDNADRVRREVRPDSRETLATYDVNGNLATLTPPGKPSHTFGYTPVDLEATYAPPDVGIGNVTTSYAWNLDRQLELVTRPDGVTIDPAYDLGGRLATVTHPGGQESYAYNPTTGKLATIAAPDATITYAYDGLLLAGTTWSGGVTGTVARTYDNDFRAMAIKLNGASLATYGYDADGLLTQAGALAITRDPQNGLVTGTTLGAVADSYAYNALGEATSYQATAGGSPLLSISYARDELGRISTKTETIEGASTTYGYTCDLAGRLVEVTKDGTPHAQYTYDASGNRLSLTSTSGSVTGTYDAQDRLRQYGATTYTYNAHGSLETKTTAAGMTAYGYDALGNLRSVLLPDNTLVEYLVDGLNRRIGRKVNGVVVKRCLYLDRLRPIAELDGAGNVVITFVYASGSNSPAFMVKGGVAYRIIKDHLGSPRLVVDAATGAVAQRMDFDEYGNVLLDTNPGFQPIGFAGGLYDPDTGLVRFGARDYDAEMGRWTAKDPIRLAGGDTNLYAYVGNDPVNFIDPSGLFFQAAWQAIVNAAQRVAQFARDAARSLGEGLKNVWDWSQRQGQKIIDWIKDFSRDQSGAINVCAEGAKRFDPNQQALIELAKEAQRRGVSLPDAQTLLQWAKEYGLRARDDIGTSHWIGGPHIHIGPVSHIPVRP
jgi:RHS repeat-associated protein